MPSLTFAATGVVTTPATDADRLDGEHRYYDVEDNADVQNLLKDSTKKDYVVNFVPSTCDKDGSVTLKCYRSVNREACDATKTIVLKKAHEFGDEKVRFSTIESYAKAMQAAKAPGFKNDSQVAGQIANLSKTYCYVEAFVCKNCGVIDVDHDIEDVATKHEPKPIEDCKSTTECGKCGKELKKAASAIKKHSFEDAEGNIKSGVKPTSEKKVCKDKDSKEVTAKTYTCTLCNETKTIYTDATGNIAKPDCKIFKNPISVVESKDGKTLYKSGTSVAVATRTDKNADWEPKDGYLVSSILANTVYEADTTVVSGGKTNYAFTCKECGYVKDSGKEKTDAVVSPDHKHAWKKVTENATCVAPAMEAAYCEGCGMYSAVANAGTDKAVAEEDMMDSFAPPVATRVANKFALGHKLNVKKVDATCETPAHYEISCSVCGSDYDGVKYVRFHEADAKPSKYLDPENGELYDNATKAGDIELPYLDPTVKRHAFTKKVVLQAANCKTNELEGYKCDTCGKMDIHNVTPVAGTKLAHEIEKVDTPATCVMTAGSVEKCKNCDYEKVLVEAKPIEGGKHTGEVWRVTKKATVFEEGVKTLVCPACGFEFGSKTPTSKAKYAAPAVKAGKKSATVTVKATADAVSYKISYKKAGGSYKTVSAQVGKKTIKKLAKGKKYTFKVIAVNAEGVEVASATKTVKVK